MPKKTDGPDLSEFTALTEVDELRRINSDLQSRLRAAKAKTEDLVAATFAGARDAMLAYGPLRPVKAPAVDKRAKTAEVALWDLGDWQGAKLTPSYNSQVMVERIGRFCDKAHRLTEIQRADHPVRDAVIVFGGDMCEGLFNFATQPFEIDATIFGQFVSVSRLIVDVVRSALSLYDSVRVVAEWGNHGRIGSKRSAVPRSDNFDRMIYEMSRQLLAGEPRLTWEDCPTDIQRVEVGAYRALAIHGDEVGRNGYVSPMTMVNHVAKWQSGAYPWTFRDCYVHHYHTDQEFSLPNGRGSVFYTGSPESDNRYALDTMASSAVPSQRLHFIDAADGRVSARYKVWLED